jgi:hypothetical protein
MTDEYLKENEFVKIVTLVWDISNTTDDILYWIFNHTEHVCAITDKCTRYSNLDTPSTVQYTWHDHCDTLQWSKLFDTINAFKPGHVLKIFIKNPEIRTQFIKTIQQSFLRNKKPIEIKVFCNNSIVYILCLTLYTAKKVTEIVNETFCENALLSSFKGYEMPDNDIVIFDYGKWQQYTEKCLQNPINYIPYYRCGNNGYRYCEK